MNPTQQQPMINIISAALLMSLLNSTLAFSFAAMMVHSTQPQLLPDMVVAVITSAAISALIMAWRGSLIGLIASPLSASMALFAEMFRTNQSSVESIWLLLFVGGTLTALSFWVLGALRMGRIVRYLPLPVLAGFLAGVGWLFVKGGFLLLGVRHFEWSVVTQVGVWISMLFALSMLLLNQKISIAKLLPLASIVTILVTLFLAPSVPGSDAWFFQLERTGNLALNGWQWWNFSEPVDWLALPWTELLTLVAISTLYVLMNATTVELKFKQELRLDHDLKIMGGFNLALSAMGGVHSSLSANHSSLAFDMQARHRLTGIYVSLFLLATLWFLEYLVRYLPIPLVAGILIFQGMQLMHRWLILSSQRFIRADRMVIAAIFLVVMFDGYLTGVIVGLVMMVLLFVREYSRLQIIYLSTYLNGAPSNVERTLKQQEQLKRHAKYARIYQLKGFIFFGSANSMVEKIKRDVIEHNQKLQTIVLDFRRVQNLDSSAVNSLQRLLQFTLEQDLEIFVTDLNKEILARLRMNENIEFGQLPEPGKLYLLDTLEMAMELLEERYLSDENVKEEESPVRTTLQNNLRLTDEQIEVLLSYFEECEFAHNQWILQKGDLANSLYLISSGYVDVGLADPETGQWIRFKKMLPGTLVGEMGLYQSEARSASARAVGRTTLLELTQSGLYKMECEEPELAIAFHRFVILTEAQRLRESNARVYSLMQS